METALDTIRGTLQPLTHNIPPRVRDIGIGLLGDVCYKQLILDIDPKFDSPECVKLAVSKALGLGIVGVSGIVKIPQLLKLINSQSAAGVSFLSYFLETVSFLVTLVYNARQGNPFSTYGESALIAAQNVAIASLVLHYGGKSAGAGAFIASLAAAGYALFNENIVDLKTLGVLQTGASVLGVASKLPQIVTIWREGSTGQLSAFAVFNYLVGSLTRIFTTLQEVNDPIILYGFIAGFTFNAILAVQMLYYWNAKPAKKLNPPTIRVESEKGEPIALTSGAKPRSNAPTTRRRG